MNVSGLKQSISKFCSSNGIDKSISKSRNTSNELINKNVSLVKITELSNEILETLEIKENCTSCKDKIKGKKQFCESLNEIESCLTGLEEEEKNIISELDGELFEINTRLNNKLLCEGCYEVKKLTDECGNRELAKFLYECRLDRKWYHSNYIRWIPFNEFKNIEYLTKGGFGEVHEATWINYYNRFYDKYRDQEVVLERVHNSNVKIVDILKEVKQEFIVITTITLKRE